MNADWASQRCHSEHGWPFDHSNADQSAKSVIQPRSFSLLLRECYLEGARCQGSNPEACNFFVACVSFGHRAFQKCGAVRNIWKGSGQGCMRRSRRRGLQRARPRACGAVPVPTASIVQDGMAVAFAQSCVDRIRRGSENNARKHHEAADIAHHRRFRASYLPGWWLDTSVRRDVYWCNMDSDCNAVSKH